MLREWRDLQFNINSEEQTIFEKLFHGRFHLLSEAGKWACDRLTEDADFGKRKSSFQMKFILILAGM